jgi:hypothetical protein
MADISPATARIVQAFDDRLVLAALYEGWQEWTPAMLQLVN